MYWHIYDPVVNSLPHWVWVWSEGLVHYIEVHQLHLPEDFLATMEENQWHVPELEHIDKLLEDGYSLEFWEDWYKRKTAK